MIVTSLKTEFLTGTGYDNQRVVNVAGARENVGTQVVQQSGIQCYNCKEHGHVPREYQKPKRAKDAAYHQEKMILCKQEEAGIWLSAEQADWRDDTDDKPDDQKLEAHYMYMEQIQEVTPYTVDNSGPIFDVEPLQKVKNNDDNYNVFANDKEHPEQPEYVNVTYLKEHGDTNITTDSLDMSNNGGELLESSNKTLVDKLKGEIKDFKTKNKSLESSKNHFKEANNKLSKTNQLMFKDLKKFQSELDRYHDVNYASKVEIDCAKAKGDLMSYKMESQKSFNEYTQKINDLNQMISEMKKELIAHQETISIMSQEKEAQNKLLIMDNLDLMLAPESDETIHLAQESTVKFGNDQIALILGYGDLVQANKSTCYIRDLKGNDILIATSSQAWLWHHRLSHLNFDTINLLLKYDIVTGLPKLKFVKDHLCSSCG
ncbi:gag-pol polyprotein [Tanacetum coccineum]